MPSIDRPLDACPLCGSSQYIAGDEIESIPGELFEQGCELTFKCEQFFLCPTCGMFWSHLDPHDLVKDAPERPPEEDREPLSREATEQKRAIRKSRFLVVAVIATVVVLGWFFDPVRLAFCVGAVVIYVLGERLVRVFRGEESLPPRPDGFVLPRAIKEFNKWEQTIVPMIWIASWALCTLVVGALLILLIDAVLQTPSTMHLMRLPDGLIYTLAGAASPLLAAAMTRRITRLLLGDRYAGFRFVCALKGQRDRRALEGIAFLVTAAAAILVPLAFDCYTRFDDERVEIDRYWSLQSQTYAYEEITELRAVRTLTAPNGNEVERLHYSVHFEDGTRWNTMILNDVDTVADAELMDFLRRKTGLEIKEVQHDDE